MTAEQFLDGVWQLTGSAPTRFDAPVLRGKPATIRRRTQPLQGKWIWSGANAMPRARRAGEDVVAFAQTMRR